MSERISPARLREMAARDHHCEECRIARELQEWRDLIPLLRETYERVYDTYSEGWWVTDAQRDAVARLVEEISDE